MARLSQFISQFQCRMQQYHQDEIKQQIYKANRKIPKLVCDLSSYYSCYSVINQAILVLSISLVIFHTVYSFSFLLQPLDFFLTPKYILFTMIFLLVGGFSGFFFCIHILQNNCIFKLIFLSQKTNENLVIDLGECRVGLQWLH